MVNWSLYRNRWWAVLYDIRMA